MAQLSTHQRANQSARGPQAASRLFGRLLICVAAAVLAGVIAGCSDDDDAASSSTPPAIASTSAAPAANAAPASSGAPPSSGGGGAGDSGATAGGPPGGGSYGGGPPGGGSYGGGPPGGYSAGPPGGYGGGPTSGYSAGPPGGDGGGPPGGYSGGYGGSTGGQPPKSNRPEDVAQWKVDDYKSALQDGDPALEKAVAQLGARAGDEESAGILVALLDELGKAPQAAGGAGAGYGGYNGAGAGAYSGQSGPPGMGGYTAGPPTGGGGPPGMGGYSPTTGPPAGGGGPPGMGGYSPTTGPPMGGGGPPGMGGYSPTTGPPAGGGGPPGMGGYTPPTGTGTTGPPGMGGYTPPAGGGRPPGMGALAPSSRPTPGRTLFSPVTVFAVAAVGWQDAGYNPADSAADSGEGNTDAGYTPPADESSDAATGPAEGNNPAGATGTSGYPTGGGYGQSGGYGAGYGQSGGYGGYGQSGSQSAAFGREQAFQAILSALMTNGSPRAWESIERLLKGELKTGLADEIVVDRVLAALLANYGGKEHASGRLLNQALSAPEQLRGPSSPGVTADQLRQKVLDLHTTSAASALDALFGVPSQAARPANGAAGGGYGASGGYGSTSGGYGASYGAQSAAYGSGGGGAAGGYGGGYNPSSADGGYQGAGGGPSGQAANAAVASAKPIDIESRAVTADEARRILDYLGQPDLLQTVESQVRGLTSITDNSAGERLALAASLPAPSLRAAQYELLQQNWMSSADSLTAQKLFQEGPRDPGFLVVLKSVPSLKTLPLRQPPTLAAQEENRIKHSWAEAQRELVRTLNARFLAAAQNQAQSASAQPPIRLHQGAVIAEEYRFAWPQDADGSVPEAFMEPFVVHYVRVNAGKVNPQQVLTHYEKQVRGGEAAFARNNFEAWIEHEGVADEPGRRRSMDVMLTVGGGGGGGGAGAYGGGGAGAYGAPGGGGAAAGAREQDVTVEILMVDIPNPRPAARDVAAKER